MFLKEEKEIIKIKKIIFNQVLEKKKPLSNEADLLHFAQYGDYLYGSTFV